MAQRLLKDKNLSEGSDNQQKQMYSIAGLPRLEYFCLVVFLLLLLQSQTVFFMVAWKES